MARWTIEEPTKLDFDGVVALRANIVAGSVSVLPTDDRPSLHVSEISGHPLEVTHEAGMLQLSHEQASLGGLFKWLQNTRGRTVVTLCLPRDCPVRLNLFTAGAVVTGLAGRISVNSASGDVTLDGVTGTIDANTASGVIEAQGLDGAITFNSVSGDLALAGGTVRRLSAHSVSGRVTADVALDTSSAISVSTVAGEVTLRLPETTSTKVALTSVSGRVDSAFPGLGSQDRAVGRTLTGTLGDGAASLSVSTVSGAIALLSRPTDIEEGKHDQ